MDKNRLFFLIDQVNKGMATSEELAEYDACLNLLTDNVQGWDANALGTRDATREELRERLNAQIYPAPAKQRRLWPRIAVAAAVLMICSIGGYFVLHQPRQITPMARVQAKDFRPGGNKAILTLANGQQVVLTGAKNGPLVSQNAVLINKTADGQINYQLSDQSKTITEKATINSIVTPRGGQYTVTLADGTKVILNAASSLKYPVAFTGAERRVELTGEAYFEVAKNKHMPFRVVSNNQVVEVLGTHFNINAYQDEPAVVTTLLEGSVNVNTSADLTRRLVPGQQAITTSGGHRINVQQADTAVTMAWTAGRFKFAGENIESIMRKVSRWYDVDISYQGDMHGMDFAGSISRYSNVSKVLAMLQSTNSIHFKLEGRRIIVMD